ncbi:anthrone oxygenase family protein [Promicromonospora sp. NPDC023805]|uniref:anthrone oxygenase family protein n=1 Tax=Promicromonospora sp. NPDC023805 TaxID=3154696 RepID=UPI0033D36F41
MVWTIFAVASVVLLGLSAGVFYGFSSFIMSGLARASDEAAGAGMSGINETALLPAFMSVFFGALLVPAGTGIWGLVEGRDGGAWVLAGAAVYLVGTFGVTMALNVPLNNRLLADHDKAAGWRAYWRLWTTWNHVRTFAGVVATVLAAVGLL